MENTASIVGFIFRKGRFGKTRSRWVLFFGLALAVGLGFFLVFRVGIDVTGLPHGAGAITFTDRTGEPLGTVLASDNDHAAWVPLRNVSPAFLSAIVAAEDARFYQHGAVDVASLARAAREYIVYGEARSGGSTITMQLARSLYPTPSTLRGKFAQIVYAERIALRSPRDAILEAYVNRIPMGGNLYGIEAAARTYFGIPARQLDLAQAAMLAAIPNDPTRLSPYAEHSWRTLRTRQRYVLDRMVATGVITSAQRDISEREQLHLLPVGDGLDIAQHFLFWLYPQITSKETEVRTTIDAPLQRFVQAQVAQVVSALAAQHVTDAAALVVDNHTGDVIAYVGSPDYYSDEALGHNDGVQALRQPGSSLKPFTYELALERGTIRSTSILQDVPTTYAIPGGRLYQPADYSTRFSGPVRVRYALANSLNVPAVRVLSSLGVDALLNRLHELGFAHLDKPPAYYGLGLTLGSGEVSLWELTHAYLTIARAGSAIPLQTVANTGDEAEEQPIGNAATWMLVTDMLADAHARAKSFGIHSVLELPFPAAVKTGTSSDFRDTWTVGFTRDYTVGVWVGNFDGSPMRDVSGVTGAGPLWNRIMLHLYEQRDPDAFPDPPGYVRLPICATTGLKPTIPGYPPCPAIVTEWVLPRDIALWGDTTARAILNVDNRIAHHDAQRLMILSPQDGAVFVLTPTNDPIARRMQRIALRSTVSSVTTRTNTATIRWSVDGKGLALDQSGDAFWPLQLGTWTIGATNGHDTADVTIRVILPPRNPRPGFSFR